MQNSGSKRDYQSEFYFKNGNNYQKQHQNENQNYEMLGVLWCQEVPGESPQISSYGFVTITRHTNLNNK